MLNSRAVSGFALSIGTGLAFESIFNTTQPVYDPERKAPPKVNLKDYTHLWVNVGTLYRNMVGACKSADVPGISDKEFKDALALEMETIESLCKNEGSGLITPVFYFCTYASLYNNPGHKSIVLRNANTEKAKVYIAKLMSAIKMLEKEHLITVLDSDLNPPFNQKALILTNIAWDLVSAKHFNRLDLIESHTGVLKNRSKWNTKYHKYKDLSNLPFNSKLLKIFGDSEIFTPMLTSLRDLILDVAVKGKWTVLTTKDKMMLDLDMYCNDKFVVQVIKSL